MWQLFGGEMDVVGPELSSLKSNCSVCVFFSFLNFFFEGHAHTVDLLHRAGGKEKQSWGQVGLWPWVQDI